MKPRPRWEVRLYSIDPLAKVLGLPAIRLVRTTTYRWRWLAFLNYWMWACSPSVAGFAFWAEIHRAAPKLRVVCDSHEGAVSVVNPKGTEEIGADRPAAPISLVRM